jgi:hypothetical protein
MSKVQHRIVGLVDSDDEPASGTPARSPARQALAEAIKRHSELVDVQHSIALARERADKALWDSIDIVEQAEKSLKAA